MTWLREIWARSGKQLQRLAGLLAAALVIGFGVEWIATSNARMIPVQPMAINDIALSPDGEILVIAYTNGQVEVRRTGHGRNLIRAFSSVNAPVMDLHLDDATEAGLRLTMARADGRLVVETALDGQALSDDVTFPRSLLTPQFKVAGDGAIWGHGVFEEGPWIGRLAPGETYAQPIIIGSASSAKMTLFSATSSRAHMLSEDQHTIWSVSGSDAGNGLGNPISIDQRMPLGEGYIALQDGHVMTAINGAWRTATNRFVEDERGLAGMYGGGLQGEQTASGEPFNPNAFTAAHRTLPFGSRILVTNDADGSSVELRVNDRGPFQDERVLDVTSAAATALGFASEGSANVRIKYLGQRGTAIGGDTRETRQLETRAQSLTLRARDEIISMDYSPDGTLIATGSASGQIQIWFADTGTLGNEVSVENGAVLSVQFSPNGQKLLTRDEAGTLQVWEARSLGRGSEAFASYPRTSSVSYSTRGDLIAIGEETSIVRVLEAETLTERIVLEGHESGVRTIDFSSDDQLLVSGSAVGTIRVWDIASGDTLMVIERDGTPLSQVVFSPDDRYILTAAVDGTITFYDSRTSEPVSITTISGSLINAGFSPDAQRLLTYESGADEIRLWDVVLPETRAVSFSGSLPGTRAVFSPTENRILTANGTDTATIWSEVSPGNWAPARRELPCRSEDGQAFFESLASNGFEKLWMWEKSEGLCQIAVSEDLISWTDLLPDDTTVVKMVPASGNTELTSFLIGRANGTVHHQGKNAVALHAVYHGHGGPITQIELARSNMGLRAAIAAADGSVQIVDLPARNASLFARLYMTVGDILYGANGVRTNMLNAIVPEPRAAALRFSYALSDPLAALQWNLRSPSEVRGGAGFIDYWAATGNFGSPDVVVALIDTGVDFSHPSLQGANILPGWDMVTDPDIGNDGDGRDSDPADPGNGCPSRQVDTSSYLGTHNLGALAAPHDDIGLAGYAPGASYIPVRAVSDCGGRLSDFNDSIRWAAGQIPQFDELGDEVWNDNPADIIVFPVTLFRACPLSMQDAINAAYEGGVILVNAAGNNQADADFSAPASCENVITVGASDGRGFLTSYSNFGAPIDLLAPGGDLGRDDDGDGNPDGIVSSKRTADCLDPITSRPTDVCLHAYEQGTSMAVNIVAGALALLKSEFPDMPREELISLLLDQATRPIGDEEIIAPCRLYPGAVPIDSDPVNCLRPSGGRILDLSMLSGRTELAPLTDRTTMITATPPAPETETETEIEDLSAAPQPKETGLPEPASTTSDAQTETETEAAEDELPQNASD